MGSLKKLYGWYPDGSACVPIKVDSAGKVVISNIPGIWSSITPPVWNLTLYDNGAGGQPATNECRCLILGSLCIVHYKGSGVKVSTSSYISVLSHSFIVPANTTAGTAIGSAWAYIGAVPVKVGIVAEDFTCYFWSDIVDNTVITHLGYTVAYEI